MRPLSCCLSAAVALGLAGCFSADRGGWDVTTDKGSGKQLAPAGESDALYGSVGSYFEAALKTAKGATLLVVQETIPVTKRKSLTFPQNYAAVRRYLPSVPKACVDAFVKANKQRTQLAAKPPQFLELTPLKRINQLFHAGGWDAVRQEHPRALGLISVARPGMCEDHQTALVYFSETRDEGGLSEVLLQAHLDDDAWRVVQKAVIAAGD